MWQCAQTQIACAHGGLIQASPGLLKEEVPHLSKTDVTAYKYLYMWAVTSSLEIDNRE